MKNSFDFSTISPDQVLQLFQQYLVESNSILDVLITNGISIPKGTNNKFEWLETQLKPSAWTLGASSLAGAFNTPATMTFVSTANLEKNMILYFISSTGLDVGNMQVKVTNVINGTTATVVLYGGSTGSALAGTETAKLMSEAVVENEKLFTGKNEWLPDRAYNFFQIFRTSVELSRTALNSVVHGDVNTLAEQLKGAFYVMRQQMSDQAIRGLRVARSSTENGTFGGLLQYLTLAGGNVLSASSAQLTPAMMNDIVQMIYNDGGQVDTIVCSSEQARKVSAFNRTGATGTNVYTMLDQASKQVGSYAMRFVSDIPVAGGLITNIVVDDKMPKDRIAFTSLSNLALVPFAGSELSIVDGTLPGQDGATGILRGEYTLRAKDQKYAGGLITNLGL